MRLTPDDFRADLTDADLERLKRSAEAEARWPVRQEVKIVVNHPVERWKLGEEVEIHGAACIVVKIDFFADFCEYTFVSKLSA